MTPWAPAISGPWDVMQEWSVGEVVRVAWDETSVTNDMHQIVAGEVRTSLDLDQEQPEVSGAH